MKKEIKDKLTTAIQELEKIINEEKLSVDAQYDAYLDWCRRQENGPHE